MDHATITQYLKEVVEKEPELIHFFDRSKKQ